MTGALATPGITVGWGGASLVLGMIVNELLAAGAPDWWSLGKKLAAFLALAAWGYFTARKPEVFTGVEHLDRLR